jgi:NADH-quinone oxidoreductase subunit K
VSPLVLYQFVALLLLVIGLFGVIWRKSLVGMLICVELMLNGAGLSIVASAQLGATSVGPEFGQVASLLVMGMAAAEATLVLAIVYVVSKRFGHVEADRIANLKG